MNRRYLGSLALAVLIAVAVGSYLYLSQPEPQAPPEPEPAASADASGTATIQHPVEEIAGAAGGDASPTQLPTLADSDAVVTEAVQGLIGADAPFDFVGSSSQIRKVVATVDNLPRNRASARLWPVPPTPGRFTVREEAGLTYLSTDNFQRYAPFVSLAASVDLDKLVALYVRFYPLFQQAYEDLGYPGRYFNDRVIEVIDHLLATPDAGDNLELVLPPQDPSVVVERPWVLYQYADPALQSLSAGQKTLVRMGSENAGRLKTVLRELRVRLAAVR